MSLPNFNYFIVRRPTANNCHEWREQPSARTTTTAHSHIRLPICVAVLSCCCNCLVLFVFRVTPCTIWYIQSPQKPMTLNYKHSVYGYFPLLFLLLYFYLFLFGVFFSCCFNIFQNYKVACIEKPLVLFSFVIAVACFMFSYLRTWANAKCTNIIP